jgi:CRISPR-associated endonuclease/helicase Cas3
MQRFAHSVEGKPEQDWEPLSHHLAAVGKLASHFAEAFGCSCIALTMGLLHDIGKRSVAYQAYIRRPRDMAGSKGPDHSTAGAKEARTLYGDKMGRLMAFGIAGHHSGLMNGAGHDAGNLERRLSKNVENYDGWRDHVGDLPPTDALTGEFSSLTPNDIEPTFSVGFRIRMLFSCLVDADFLETEAFYAQARGEARPPRGGVLRPEHLDRVRAFMAKHRRDDTPVNRLRSQILDHANGKAGLPPGLFTLTVPTGGGKTLTSLSFAMEHARTHGLRRIIFAIPFAAITEQTAEIFREDIGLGQDVLEHHSNFDWDQRPPAGDNDSEGEGAAGLAKLRRDAENWDAPIIVTTAVQLFESLFAKRTSKSRKLHNLAKSVIILDEAQSLPVRLLRPCMAVIDELARNYGASIILCTATQPALRIEDGALPTTPKDMVEGLDIPQERELAPDPKTLYARLKRVNVTWRREPIADAVIAARFAEQPQMLCIVNSRAHARDLFEAIREQDGAIHLTTLMCARHRRAVLAKARADLKAGQPMRLVATSLIEAGVDISFPEVWRAAAGLQNIAQAAGRANRSGELGPLGEKFGQTVIFEPADHKMPPAIVAFYDPAKSVLRQEGCDPLSLDAVQDYYKWLYWQQGYPALDKATLRDGTPFPILPAIRATTSDLGIPFADMADAFRMIDDVMDPVIIPWDDEAKAAIATLKSAPFPPSGIQRKLQQYIVPIPAKVRADMLARGAVQPIRQTDYGDRFVVLENPSLYDHALGLRLDDPTWRASEDNIL